MKCISYLIVGITLFHGCCDCDCESVRRKVERDAYERALRKRDSMDVYWKIVDEQEKLEAENKRKKSGRK